MYCEPKQILHNVLILIVLIEYENTNFHQHVPTVFIPQTTVINTVSTVLFTDWLQQVET